MPRLNNLLVVLAALFVACLIIHESHGVSLKEDLTLKKSEKEALDKVKCITFFIGIFSEFDIHSVM